MLNPGDIARSDTVFNALGDSLAKAYHPAEFSIMAFIESRGWVRSGAPAHARCSGTFVMAEVHPSNAPPYRFMIQREDALGADTHESIVTYIKRHDFSEFERTDGKGYYYQFIPRWGGDPAQTKEWEAGKLGGEIVKDGATGAESSERAPQ